MKLLDDGRTVELRLPKDASLYALAFLVDQPRGYLPRVAGREWVCSRVKGGVAVQQVSRKTRRATKLRRADLHKLQLGLVSFAQDGFHGKDVRKALVGSAKGHLCGVLDELVYKSIGSKSRPKAFRHRFGGLLPWLVVDDGKLVAVGNFHYDPDRGIVDKE